MTRSWEVKATTEGLVASHPRLPLTQESHLFLPCLQSTGSLQLVGLSTRPWPSLSLEALGSRAGTHVCRLQMVGPGLRGSS